MAVLIQFPLSEVSQEKCAECLWFTQELKVPVCALAGSILRQLIIAAAFSSSRVPDLSLLSEWLRSPIFVRKVNTIPDSSCLIDPPSLKALRGEQPKLLPAFTFSSGGDPAQGVLNKENPSVKNFRGIYPVFDKTSSALTVSLGEI